MRSNYEEKKANRIDRYHRLAEKFKHESDARYKRFSQLAEVIPMGQPILVGHHSEKRHRAHLEKMDQNMRSSWEAGKKSAHYSDRAETAEKNTAISSDDPNCLERLEEKLTKLQELQEKLKQVKAALRKYIKDPNSFETSGLDERFRKHFQDYIDSGYAWEKEPVKHYQLTNNNANINTVKKRIARLKHIEQAVHTEHNFGDIRIVENPGENRVQIFFPGKPSYEKRKELKSRGFRWAPSIGCWQAYYSNQSKWAAAELTKDQK